MSPTAAFEAEAQSVRVDSASAVENIRVTDASLGFPFQAEPTIVLDPQGRIFAGWKEMNETGGANRVAFGRSLDGGRTWEKSLFGSPDAGQSDPWLALDELDRIYYARPDAYAGEPGEYVSRSDDGGLTWGPAVNIHDGSDCRDHGGHCPDKGSIQSDGNETIYASYVDAGPSEPYGMKIIATRSLDGGATWGPSSILVTGLNPFAPAVASRPNGRAHVVWWQAFSGTQPGGNIFVSTTTDRGETWSSPIRVNPVPRSAVYYYQPNPKRLPYPWPATDSSGTLFVAWGDKAKGEYNIVVVRSDDGGATWSAPVQVNDTDTGDQWMATIAVDANDVLHAAWFDERTGDINLYYANSTDGGRTWSPNLRVTDQETPAGTHSLGEYLGLAADQNGAAHLVWTDGRDGGSAIYYARTAPLFSEGPCVAGVATLCLNGGRFEVRVDWRVPSQSRSGQGTAVPLTGDTGYFWFFDGNNVELVVKALDGRAVNGKFWVFYGALSNVEYTLTVRDTETGFVKTYFNPSGELASVADTSAFNGGAAAFGIEVAPSTASAEQIETRSAEELYALLTKGLVARSSQAAPCTAGSTTLCLNQGRFQVQVDWRVPSQGRSGSGMAVPVTGDTGYLWFFNDANVELIVKVLDGRPVNGHFWVFYGALSNVQYTIRVLDTETGAVKTYENPSGTLASYADTSAF